MTDLSIHARGRVERAAAILAELEADHERLTALSLEIAERFGRCDAALNKARELLGLELTHDAEAKGVKAQAGAKRKQETAA